MGIFRRQKNYSNQLQAVLETGGLHERQLAAIPQISEGPAGIDFHAEVYRDGSLLVSRGMGTIRIPLHKVQRFLEWANAIYFAEEEPIR